MSVEGCEFIAKGANGAVYRYDAETIVKTYFAKDALPEIKQERENARRAFVLGINTAIPYGIVRVGDGYGTVTELLNAVSVTKLIRNNPEDMTLAAKYYIDMLKSIHAIKVEDGEVPDMKETALDWADFVAPHLPEAEGKKLRDLIRAVPKQNTLMHGDYHTNNIMVQNGEPLLIDMDTLCMGHPVFELGCTHCRRTHSGITGKDYLSYGFCICDSCSALCLSLHICHLALSLFDRSGSICRTDNHGSDHK